MWRIATIGATFSGNKGAASMLQSLLDNLSPLLEDVHFSVLSVYPSDDRQLNENDQVEIVSARPVTLVLAMPLAVLWVLFRRLRLPLELLRRSSLLVALEKCDVLVDLSGISFSDGRTVELFYNVACILPALLMGKRVVKYSQAMGPFRTVLNYRLAKALLPRLALNIARGRTTLGYLEDLGLENIVLCADAAFSMRRREIKVDDEVLPVPKGFNNSRVIGISVSSVVQSYSQHQRIDYSRVLASFSDKAIEQGYVVRLIAHSVKESRRGGRTDDVDACLSVYELIQRKQSCQLVIDDYSPSTLSLIIGECDFIIASRFHAMVSALAMEVPTIVTSWSHKYAEVLEMFELEEWTVGYEVLSIETLWEKFQELVECENEIRDKISQHLPDVVASSRRNASLVVSLLER
jgi:colanic acid/amylovoran biosynthesis protein